MRASSQGRRTVLRGRFGKAGQCLEGYGRGVGPDGERTGRGKGGRGARPAEHRGERGHQDDDGRGEPPEQLGPRSDTTLGTVLAQQAEPSGGTAL
jgi:hypothetical protein